MAKSQKHEIRIGLLKVTVTIRSHAGKKVPSFKLERLFRDGSVWRHSTRLGSDDLLIAAKLMELAYDWAVRQGLLNHCTPILEFQQQDESS